MPSTAIRAICLRFAHPNLSGLSGGLVWAAATAIAHPDLAEPGESGLTAGNWVVLVGIALIGLSIAYGTGRWAWSGSSRRLGGAAGVLAVAAATMVVAPWSGWPAEWATGSGARTIAEFSMRHHITGADAWTVALVLMALAMVLSRTAASGLSASAARRQPHRSAANSAARRQVAA